MNRKEKSASDQSWPMEDGESKRLLKESVDNPAAFDKLHNAWRKIICNLIVAKGARLYDVEDIVQEVFLKLWKTASCFRGDCSFVVWLWKAAHFCWVSHVRKSKCLREDQQITLEDWVCNGDTITPNYMIAEPVSPSKSVEISDMLVFISLEIGRVGGSERDVRIFLRRAIKQESAAKIAEDENVSKFVVSQATKRVRQQLELHMASNWH